MYNKIHSFIANLSLEKINKFLMFLALASLLVRSGDFNSTYIPKPFELFFTIIVFLTFIDLVKNKKLKEFWSSIPRNIWLAVGGLIISTLIGWSITLFIRRIPMETEMILEFGRMFIAITLFLLIFFYTRENAVLVKRYFYALLSPVVYVILLFSPKFADAHNLTIGGRFYGLTNNVNTISRLLLMPGLFFITNSIFEFKNKWQKVLYVLVSVSIVALILWTASRGSALSLILGSLLAATLLLVKNFSFKKVFETGLVLFVIFFLGFIFTPYSGKQVVLNRILNKDTSQTNYRYLKNESLKNIMENSLLEKNKVIDNDGNSKIINESDDSRTPETRLEIWPFYLKQAIKNPLGVGPAYNLHMKVYISNFKDYFSSGAHNSFISIFLWGGILGFASFCYLIFLAINNLRKNLKLNFNAVVVAMSCIFFALTFGMLFDDNSKLLWWWAIMALALKYKI